MPLISYISIPIRLADNQYKYIRVSLDDIGKLLELAQFRSLPNY